MDMKKIRNVHIERRKINLLKDLKIRDRFEEKLLN